MQQKVKKKKKESSETGYLEISRRKYRGHQNQKNVVESSGVWIYYFRLCVFRVAMRQKKWNIEVAGTLPKLNLGDGSYVQWSRGL